MWVNCHCSNFGTLVNLVYDTFLFQSNFAFYCIIMHDFKFINDFHFSEVDITLLHADLM